MSQSIEQLEAQIAELQKTLESMKSPKLEVLREFTGQYFNLYQGNQYRRMVSDEIPIWECYIEAKKDWVILNKRQTKEMEELYNTHCVDTEE